MLDFVEIVYSRQSLAPIKKKLVCNSEKKYLVASQKIDNFIFTIYKIHLLKKYLIL